RVAFAADVIERPTQLGRNAFLVSEAVARNTFFLRENLFSLIRSCHHCACRCTQREHARQKTPLLDLTHLPSPPFLPRHLCFVSPLIIDARHDRMGPVIGGAIHVTLSDNSCYIRFCREPTQLVSGR